MNVDKPVRAMDRASLELGLLSKDPSVISDALVSMAFFESDWYWAQERCLDFLNFSDLQARGLAATCLGHIARVHGKLDKARVNTLLLEAIKMSPEISGRIEDALDDIATFIVDAKT